MISPSILALLLALSCALFQGVANAQDGGDDAPPDMGTMFGGPDQICTPYSCPKPYVPLAKWPLGITSTGCQGMGSGGISMMTMGGPNEYRHIDHCCHSRNACYQLCGSNKQTCDAEMEKCMEKSCDEAGSEKEECGKMKSIVSLIGKMGGCNEYDSYQRQNCECVDKGKVEEKMERVLRNFYKKFNPGGIDKVKGLIEKAEGKRAVFNKILNGLVKKYPAAIKKKEIEMPDPMKMDL